MVKKWQILHSERLGNYRVFTVRQDTCRSPRSGQEHTFFVIEGTEWTNIIPITEDGHVVMIEQFRHGVQAVTLEVPGGMIDADDASPVAAARRELLEETGYEAEELIPLGVAAPNPAIQNNRCHTFLARPARQVRRQDLDSAEDIHIRLVPLADIPGLIADGSISHALVIVAFHWYHLFEVGLIKR
ncbi:MAG: NUDIX hydrolase [Acidobacteria bacterium]|nr:NUDIX hydrolase [Acidobacteriota bacterium]MBI3658831.1 NUDIX hydrolase [Acidobacteriota bacterium]